MNVTPKMPPSFHSPYAYQYPVGMGGLLSTLTFGLLGNKKPKAVTLSHEEIMSQMALVITNKLAAAGKSVDPAKAKASAGYLLNEYSAWEQVLTDPNVVDSITNQAITSLLNSNLITVAPGYQGAGTVVSATPVATATDIPVTLTSPNMLMLGGAGLLALVLLKRRRRG